MGDGAGPTLPAKRIFFFFRAQFTMSWSHPIQVHEYRVDGGKDESWEAGSIHTRLCMRGAEMVVTGLSLFIRNACSKQVGG